MRSVFQIRAPATGNAREPMEVMNNRQPWIVTDYYNLSQYDVKIQSTQNPSDSKVACSLPKKQQ